MLTTTPRTATGILIGSAYEDQYAAERAWIEAGVSRYRSLCDRAVERGDGASLRASERLVHGWMQVMVPAVSASHAAMARGDAGKGFALISEVARRLDPQRTALIAVRRALSETMRSPSVSLANVAYKAGRDVIEQVHQDLYQHQYASDEAAVGRVMRHCSPRVLRRWMRLRKVADHWSIRMCGGIGLWLMEMVVSHCLVSRRSDDSWVPAFICGLDGRVGRRHASYMLSASPETMDSIEDGHLFRAFLRPRLAAMIVPPALWSHDGEGGYLSIRSPFIARQQRSQSKALASSPPTHGWAGINAMARVPMRINARLLAVMDEAWSSGGGLVGMPSAEPAPIPPRPSDESALDSWRREAAEIHAANASQRSVRFALISSLTEARRLAAVGRFYQPHQCDFRGRCYAMPLALNHQMGDMQRSLYLFDEAGRLDERAGWWLRVHAANCWGLDKSPFAARVEWSVEHERMMVQAARDPIRAVEWWSRADQPWQFLAACMAISDPEVGCRLPVQIDGTANGLQHYAAMGRDPVAAAAVNLRGGDPVDPYATVLRRVQPIVMRDAASGDANAVAVLPYTTRSVIKQTVMTVPYNVTRIGAGRQIRDNLKRAGMVGTAMQVGAAAQYLSGLTLSSIGEVFASAVGIMRWLESASRSICHADARNLVSWTTPRGFVVMQPYRLDREIRLPVQRYKISFRAAGDRVDRRAQSRGLPPNVVHSLDADHCRSIAIRCGEEGIPFAGVHDSVWCPAAMVDRLSEIVREEFVGLHSIDVVGMLRSQWEERYGITLADPPPLGDWNVAECMSAPYMFS